VLQKKKGPLIKLMCGNGKFRENIHKKPEVAKPPKTEITIMPFQDFQKTSVKF
jgi:TolB-like protein